MSKFKYDIITLIGLIENRPCLWDKTADSFKDKIQRQNAWTEVYVSLEEDFFQKNKKEQQNIAEVINGKWQNIRDAFIRSLKRRSGQSNKKKYLYHDHLQFLMKVLCKDEPESSIQDSQQSQIEEEELGSETEVEEQADSNSKQIIKQTHNPSKKARLQKHINREILKTLNSKTTFDEDQAFFISITSFVRRMSEDDKLEFRMSVLQLIKDINSRRNNLPVSVPSLSPSISSPISRTETPFSQDQTSITDTSHYNQQPHLAQHPMQLSCDARAPNISNTLPGLMPFR